MTVVIQDATEPREKLKRMIYINIIDDMPSKQICNLSFNENNLKINIAKDAYSLLKISTLEIAKHKKNLVDNALKLL
tara:strand:+ start:678 stop:908 length:231 start_codon:yes stop_codon:yes gene_type:complete